MIRWSKDGQGSPKEQDVPLLPEHALWASPSGQVAELPGSREVYAVIRDDSARLQQPKASAELTTMLPKLVNPPSAAPRVREQGGHLVIETEPGLDVAAT